MTVHSIELSSHPALINRTLAWTGETLDKITDAAAPANIETLTYTKSHREL